MSEDDDRLVAVGVELAQLLVQHGMPDDCRLLDVGSGYGRLAIGLKTLGFRGRYVGFDILPRHVAWCRRHLADGDRWRFRHLDVRNARYNPAGTIPGDQVRFPVRDDSKDFAALFSIFSHFYAADIRRYLAELRRVLAPGGRVLATFYLYDDDRLPAITDPARQYPLLHELDDNCRYASERDPLLCIGYRESFVRQLADETGLTVERVVRGQWAGDQPAAPDRSWQDVVILRRPEVTFADRVRRRLGRG
jgi:SAM-dependent methyltransferase